MKNKKMKIFNGLLITMFMQSFIVGAGLNTTAYAATTGLTISVTDSSNQSIPVYTNNGGAVINNIFSNPVRLAAGSTAKISYNFTGVSFSKYKFVQASNLTTIPQFPQDSAMTNIDLPLPNTYDAYKDDISKQNYLTTKHYQYAGKAGTASARNVSFGTPVFDGVFEQEAKTDTTKNPVKYDLGSTNGSNFYVGQRGSESDSWTAYGSAQSKSGSNTIPYNGDYYPKTKYASWKAMKIWGYFSPQKSGNYTLGAWSDDGAYGYIIVNGTQQVFVDDWSLQAPFDRTKNTSIYLKGADSGTKYYYPIYMEWYEGCPTQAAFVPEYKYNNGSFTAIPEGEFYSSKTTTPGDIAGAYFGDVSGINFPAQDGIYYIATKFISMEGTTQGLYGPFVIDNTKPVLNNLTVTSSNANGNKWADTGNTLTIKFTASENLSGNPQILINGFAANASITKDSQNNYTATVNIGSDGSIDSVGDKLLDGPITVQAAHYSDLYGNMGDPVQDSSVIYDNTAPTAAITYSANPTSVGIEAITVTYSEPVKSGETPKISINQQGTADITSQNMTIVGTDRKTWTYNYTVNTANGSTYIDGDVKVSLSAVHDAAGNAAASPTGDTFSINTKAPTVTLNFSANPVSAGTETITATYSSPVKSGETPLISITQQGTAKITSQPMTAGTDRTTWTYNYTVNAANGTTYKDGNAAVSLSTVHDALGNAAAAPQVNTFVIDTKAPTVAITYSANPVDAGTEVITATYSEPVKAGEIPQISVNQQGTADTASQNMTAVGSDRTVWSYNYTVNAANGSSYADGEARVSLSAVHDAAQNAAAAPTGNTFVIDTTPPTATIGMPSAAIANSGPITYTVTYSGADRVTFNSSNVSLVKTGTADGTVTASGTGNARTVTVSNITGDGTLGIRIAAGTASDIAGNSALAPSDSTAFTVCNTAPSITLTPNTTGWTNTDVIVTITANPSGSGNGIAAIKWLSGNHTAKDFTSSVPALTGNSSDVDTNGTYTVYAVDNLGNAAVKTIQVNNIDKTAPNLDVKETPTALTNHNVTMNVTAADNVGIDVTKWMPGIKTAADFEGTAGTVVNGNAFTVSSNGDYTVYTRDLAGNEAVKSTNVSNIDKTAPGAPVITSPSDGTTLKDNKPTITGTGEAGATVTVYDNGTAIGTAAVDSSGNWSFEIVNALADGNHAITATQSDAAGNESPSSNTVNIKIDTTVVVPLEAPVITSPEDGATINNNKPTITGTGEAGATVTIYDNGTAIGTATVDSNGVWSYEVATALEDGNHAISATQSDASGRVSTSSNTVNIIVSSLKSSVLRHGLYIGNNLSNEYISVSANNQFDVVKNIPVTIAMLVDIENSKPQIPINIAGGLRNTSITFNKYELVKDSKSGKYSILPNTLQSYNQSPYSSAIALTNNIGGKSFSLENGKQYIIFYSVTPNGNSSTITISADIDKSMVDPDTESQIVLNVKDLPSVQ